MSLTWICHNLPVWSKREPSDSKGQWMITHALCLSNTLLCSGVALWLFTTPCFHKSSPNGSLLLLLLILSLVGVAQWHFATPVSSQEFAQWLILVTTAFGTEWPNGTLLLLCFFTRVGQVANSCYFLTFGSDSNSPQWMEPEGTSSFRIVTSCPKSSQSPPNGWKNATLEFSWHCPFKPVLRGDRFSL